MLLSVLFWFLPSVWNISSAFRIPFIINGDKADVGEFPWQVSLMIENSRHICGAALISEKFLVTAAHCAGFQANAYTVLLGAHDKDTRQQGNPTEYKVDKITINENYHASSTKASGPGDIAIMRLQTPADLSSQYIRPIALAEKEDNFDNMRCWTSGWGRTSAPVNKLPNTLQKLPVRVVAERYCAAPGPGQICVFGSYSYTSPCNGDSGGPLMCMKDGEMKLLGVLSYSYGDCSSDMPAVYSSVS